MYPQDKNTPLFISALGGHADVVRALIEAGAEVDVECGDSAVTEVRNGIGCTLSAHPPLDNDRPTPQYLMSQRVIFPAAWSRTAALSLARARARAVSHGPLCSGRQRLREDCGGAAGSQGRPEPVQPQGEIARGVGCG